MLHVDERWTPTIEYVTGLLSPEYAPAFILGALCWFLIDFLIHNLKFLVRIGILFLFALVLGVVSISENGVTLAN